MNTALRGSDASDMLNPYASISDESLKLFKKSTNFCLEGPLPTR